MIEAVLGTSLGVYISVTLGVLGFAAWMTGQAIAITWRPPWQVVIYCALLGLVARFLIYALFEGELLSLSGVLVDVVVLNLLGLVAFRVSRVRKMVQQYPWLYERSTPWGYRAKGVSQ